MSPTSPTFITLNGQLIKAHQQIRELEAGGAELLAQIRILCAVIADLTHEIHTRSTVELPSTTVPTSTLDSDRDRRVANGDHADTSHTPQYGCPAAADSQSTRPRPTLASTAPLGTQRTKTRRSHAG
jgi:hypothetical protein